MPTSILLVDDDPIVLENYQFALDESPIANLLKVYKASSIAEANAAFDEDPAIKIVAMDGDLGNGIEETCQFVKELRARGFDGTIFAVSGNSRYCSMLLDAGGNFYASKSNAIPAICHQAR